MVKFEIKEDFLLDDKPFKILSGAIHYFRVPRGSWGHSLYNLKALGFNTVETYVAWNVHEKKPGEFDFTGQNDLSAFLTEAKKQGLYAIVRPSPYICAEWEFGGLPAWLLETKAKPRRMDECFLNYVKRYYEHLFQELRPHFSTQGGNILMLQIENEYGSYSEDKAYLKAIKNLMDDEGVDIPYCTSDGPWPACLEAGSLVEEGILPTGNFGSRGPENFAALKAFQEKHGEPHWPLMCMEFWDGWFNRWGEPIVTRETDELVGALRETVRLGSVNLYMFHGGTNFGFMNGCSARLAHDLPQITSYDYGAPLDEQGNPTEKYYAIQRMLKEEFPDLPQGEPKIKENLTPQKLTCEARTNLFEQLDVLGDTVATTYPKTMEALGQGYGYHVYQTMVPKRADEERLRLIDGRDRAQVYWNGEWVATQYQEAIGEDITVPAEEEHNDLWLLMENMGRVNYGHKLLAETQHKGLRQGVMQDLHFVLDWRQTPVDFSRIDQLDYSKAYKPKQPSFSRFILEVLEPKDCFIDLSHFGKGLAIVNGQILGRFWDIGPTLSLYCPGEFLNTGRNIITVFETEGRLSNELAIVSEPVFKEMEE